MSSEFRPQPQSGVAQARYRHVSIGHSAVELSERHGNLHMRSLEPLAPLPLRLLDRLVHWAQVRPRQTFIAAREQGGDWRGSDVIGRRTVYAIGSIRSLAVTSLARDGDGKTVTIPTGEKVTDKNRLLHPLRRRADGSHEAVSSDAALNEIAEKLTRIKDRFGARAIAAYSGTMASICW